jgi:hypothetical protein
LRNKSDNGNETKAMIIVGSKSTYIMSVNGAKPGCPKPKET